MKKSLIGFLAIAMVLGMVGTSLAADWNFYGSSRVTMFWVGESAERSGVTGTGGDSEADTDLQMGMAGNSRIGAKVKAGDVAGRFEYGHTDDADVRLLYGTWNFGAGSFTAGQFYTPIHHAGWLGQVIGGDLGLILNGMAYAGRQQGLMLSFGTFKIALLKPNVSGASSTTDVILPKIEARYTFKTDMFAIGGFGAFMTWQAAQGTDTTNVTAYLLGVDFKVTPGMFWIKGDAYIGSNTGNMGVAGRINTNTDEVSVGATDTTDAKVIGGAIGIGAKFSDMLKIEGGVGYVKGERDIDGGVKTESAVMEYYVNLPITLAKGVYLVPEIDVIDYGTDKSTTAGVETETDNGTTTYFGAKFQINF